MRTVEIQAISWVTPWGCEAPGQEADRGEEGLLSHIEMGNNTRRGIATPGPCETPVSKNQECEVHNKLLLTQSSWGLTQNFLPPNEEEWSPGPMTGSGISPNHDSMDT